MKKTLLLFALTTSIFFKNFSQCPIITCTNSLLSPCSSTGQAVTATSNYSSNITSRWLAPGNLLMASAGTATSVVYLNSAGIYTVEFKDNQSNCVTSHTLSVSLSPGKPIFTLSASSSSQNCINSVNGFTIVNANTDPPGAPFVHAMGNVTTVPVFTFSPFTFSTNSCGNFYIQIKDVITQCVSSQTLQIQCSNFIPPNVSILSSQTVCVGSSITLTASGASSFTWNTGATGPTLNVLPTSLTTFTVLGSFPVNGNCLGSATFAVNSNTTCSNVWPGDANRDGVVSNTDVFEIGLAFNATGPARTTTSNAWASQYATNWTGTLSTGWNRNHADCNGNGTINNADTVAIFNNFSLSHSFKATENNALNSDISLTLPATVYAGQWNKADILLGDASAPINQLYGVAFDVNIDQSMLDNNAAHILYTSSFLNAGNQNVQFRKNDVGNGKIYAASVRVDGMNVNGNGKIGELWFKVSSSVAANSVLHLSVSNSVKVGNNGISSVLSSGSSSATVSTNALKLNELNLLERSVSFYPNPANNQFTLRSELGLSVTYSIIDLLGREIMKGEFSKNKTISLSDLENGTYFIRFTSGTQGSCKKLVVSR